MLTVRASEERGHANHGWLDSRFSFSFAEYYDPKQMGFRALRVINEDRIAGGMGFGKHPHKDMEILTYVLEGAIAHEDSTGSSETLTPGELQHMSAGSGIRHSEINPLQDQECHLLQIWLLPNQQGIAPAYEQKRFSVGEEKNKLHLLASKDGRGESFVLRSDAELLAAKLDAGKSVTHTFRGGYGWVQVARGEVTVNGTTLKQGDAAILSAEKTATISSESGEVLVFDLD